MARNIEAILLAHEAVIIALIQTHQNPEEAFTVFSRTYPDMQRNLNKRGTPEDTQLAKDLYTEVSRFAVMFKRGN
jgi:hypothetical protein